MKQWTRFFSSIVALAPLIGTAATPLVILLAFAGGSANLAPVEFLCWSLKLTLFALWEPAAAYGFGIFMAFVDTHVFVVYSAMLLVIFGSVPLALTTKRRLPSTIVAATCAGASAFTFLIAVCAWEFGNFASGGYGFLTLLLVLITISAMGKCGAILIGHKVFGLSWFKSASAVSAATLSLLVLMIIGYLPLTIAACVAAAIVWGVVASRKPALPPQDPSLQ